MKRIIHRKARWNFTKAECNQNGDIEITNIKKKVTCKKCLWMIG